MAIISAYFNNPLKVSMTPGSKYFSIPYATAFIKDGTWRLAANYPSAIPVKEFDDSQWVISTIIFSKDISKNFSTREVNMRGERNGEATTPIIE